MYKKRNHRSQIISVYHQRFIQRITTRTRDYKNTHHKATAVGLTHDFGSSEHKHDTSDTKIYFFIHFLVNKNSKPISFKPEISIFVTRES